MPCRWWREGYAVNLDGAVWSLWRPAGPGKGYLLNPADPRWLRPTEKENGYLAVGGSYVHRIVWQAWTGLQADGFEVRHLNGDRLDNRLENLMAGTTTENGLDKDRHGTRPKLAGHHNSKMTSDQVLEMRRLRGLGLPVDRVIDLVGPPVSRSCAYDAMSGRTWKALLPG